MYPSLRVAVYRRLWLGIVPYHFAFQVGIVTTGYAAITLAGSAFEVGLIVGAWGLPVLVLPPIGGVAADRASRRRIMLGAQVVLLAATLVIVGLAATSTLAGWHLVGLGLIQGTTYSFFAPSRTAYTASAVKPTMVANAISAYSLSDYFSAVVGPLVGGIILTVTGGAAAGYLVMCAIYFGVFWIFAGLPEQPVSSTHGRNGVRGPIGEALGYVWRSPALTRAFLLAACATLLGMPFQQLMPVFADRVFAVDAAGLGLLLTSAGFGAVAGSITVARIGYTRLRQWQIPLGAGFGLAVLTFALTTTFPLALAAAVVAGMTASSLAIVNYALMIAATTPDLYGRVASLYQLTFALAPLGAVPLAAIADRVGAQAAVGAAGVLLLLAVVAIWARARVVGQ